jgi:hypothetical protein
MSHSLRAEFLLDMLKSLENECPEVFPREVQELLQRDISYLYDWRHALLSMSIFT